MQLDTRNNLNRLAYFVATVEEGAITAAAARLGVSKAVVSKQLQLLEEEAGVGLLHRNTRGMQPTDAGQNFYEKAKAVVTQADDAFASIADRGGTAKGRLRLTAPVDYGAAHVAIIVTTFCEKYPEVEIDLTLTDAQLDLIEGRFDLAFRVGWLKDSGNLARKLMAFEDIAVATPATRERFALHAPDNLARAPFVGNQAFASQKDWRFTRDGEKVDVPLHPHYRMNIVLVIRRAILTTNSFAILPDFLVEDDLKAGHLVRLLPDWTLRAGGLYTVTPPGRVRSHALTLLLEMIHKSARGVKITG